MVVHPRVDKMRIFALFILLLTTIVAAGQEQFAINEQGLTPKSISSTANPDSQEQLYEKIISWLENTEEHKIEVGETAINEKIHFDLFKGNAVSLADRYYNAKYVIQINCEDGKYTIQPTKIFLKVNSKYDMGWKEFSISDASEFFKKGKVIRKYKAYLQDLTTPLNDFQNALQSHLIDK